MEDCAMGVETKLKAERGNGVAIVERGITENRRKS